jgi:hypothetical protein
MTTATIGVHRPSRLSLQAPCGLPSLPRSPAASTTFTDVQTLPTDASRLAGSAFDAELGAEVDTDTLISCLTNFTLTGDDSFPKAAPPQPSSALGSREEQRRIYLGPKLSDRATGGPDAGPLIERFSCLFKDRECSLPPMGGVDVMGRV